MSRSARKGQIGGKNWRLLGNAILVRPLEKSSQTEGGILIPEVSEYEKFRQGEVIAVGPGLHAGINPQNGSPVTLPMGVKVGDIVIVDLTAGVPLGSKDETVLLFQETRVMAVLDE